jgi:hypothetical protein
MMPAMAAPLSASVGDIFQVPLSDSQVGHGQVVADYGTTGGHFYFIGFRAAFEVEAVPELAAIRNGRIALLALSMDPLLRIGRWQIVGNQPVDKERIPWPTYKVATAPGMYAMTDHLGTVRQQATHDQEVALPFLSVVAPIRFENAMKAIHGLAEWHPAFEALLIG